MTMMVFLGILLCVAGMTAGQILFKQAASQWVSNENIILGLITNKALMVAVIIYGLTTILWVFLLRFVDLSKAYPIMAINFVLVPIAASYLYQEQIKMEYWVGISLIIIGIVICSR